MTSLVHLANTDVEFEYALSTSRSIEQNWSRHPACLQLQFLPLLYAEPQDIVAVTALPSSDYLKNLQHMRGGLEKTPRLALLQDIEPFQAKECLSWGPSQQVQAWANARQMVYHLPTDWKTICTVNSKAFSFLYTCLSQAALIHHEQDLIHWLNHTPGPKVLKTCFGLSGNGHRHLIDSTISKELLNFCCKEWQQKRPLIGEPWLDRVEDFSTQWLIHPNQAIEWIGATRFETDHQGNYKGTLVGSEKILFASLQSFLEEHKSIAQKALKEIASKGFFGFIGIDALLYRHPHHQSICLYPVVEINARQTMSLVALRLQSRICPQHTLRLTFQKGDFNIFSLLPNQLINSTGKVIRFGRQLNITII